MSRHHIVMKISDSVSIPQINKHVSPPHDPSLQANQFTQILVQPMEQMREDLHHIAVLLSLHRAVIWEVIVITKWKLEIMSPRSLPHSLIQL